MAEENGNQTSSTAPDITHRLTIHGLTLVEAQLISDLALHLCQRPLSIDMHVEIFRREGPSPSKDVSQGERS